MTRRYGVIGDPIGHSLSPLIHRGWLNASGIDAVYDPIRVAEDAFSETISSLEKSGICGLNVTLPHKHNALALATRQSETAKAIGAANTLTFDPGHGWSADNTDVPGFLAALSDAGVSNIRGKQVTILGAGGSAKAVAYALHQGGAKLTILNRTLSRAEALSESVTCGHAAYGAIDQLTEHLSEAELVINTTSLGYSDNIFDLPDGDGRLFFDISYGAAALPQLAHARAKGWETADGLFMLVAQAAESYQIWFGADPDRQSALERCRAELAVS